MRWFRRKPVKVEVVRRQENKLRLSEWRNDPQLCNVAAKVLADSNLRLMLQVLENDHPSRTVLPYAVSLDDRAVHQARCEGYEMCLANLEALGVCTVPAELVESVFQP